MANFYCPGFCENAIVFRKLEYVKKYFPQCIIEDRKITHVYGCFPSCIWNGGGTWLDAPAMRQSIEDVFLWYKNATDFIIQLTFTNPILKETDVYDRYANAILDCGMEILGPDRLEILVTSPCLEKYIREKYPEAKIDKSIIATTRDENNCTTVEEYIKLLDSYSRICIPRKKVNDKDFILQFPQELKDRVELLCTDPCDIYCPRLYTHYEDMAKPQLWEKCSAESTQCSAFTQDEIIKRSKYQIYQITPIEVSAYEVLGWTEFKISGRVCSAQSPIELIPYIIKPEYVVDILIDIYADLFGGTAIIPSSEFWCDYNI